MYLACEEKWKRDHQWAGYGGYAPIMPPWGPPMLPTEKCEHEEAAAEQ